MDAHDCRDAGGNAAQAQLLSSDPARYESYLLRPNYVTVFPDGSEMLDRM